MNRAFWRLIVVCFSLTVSLRAPALAQCTTTINVESIDEEYFYISDLLNSIALNPLLAGTPVVVVAAGVGLVEGYQTGCANFDVAGLRFEGDDFRFDFTPITLRAITGIAQDFFTKGVTYNGLALNLIPEVTPCQRMPFNTITRMGGEMGVFTAHVGTGPYRRKIRRGTYHTCRDVVLENASSSPIEMPIRISGSVVAAEAFGWTPLTFAKAKMRVHGTIGGQAFEDKAEVESTSIFPEEKDINVTRRITVAPGAGRYTVHVDINAEAETIVQAKSAGLFGSLADSATAGVDFPNSIAVGNFTGPNGAPLPVGVRIYDAEDGSVYADTRVFPGTPNLIVTGGLARDPATNEVIADVTVTNIGPGEAHNVQIAGATLNRMATTSVLPEFIGRLIPELPMGRATRQLRFPASVGASGTRTILRVNGTWQGGTFGGSFRVTLP